MDLYTYRMLSYTVVDGDTIKGDLDVGFFMTKRANIRLTGINTPEKRGREKVAGLLVKEVAEMWLSTRGDAIIIQSNGLDKYGRVLGTVWAAGVNLNEWLMAERLAQAYGGGRKVSFSDEELKEVEIRCHEILKVLRADDSDPSQEEFQFDEGNSK